MTNQDRILQLVLSDEKLRLFYEYDLEESLSIDDALNSENPIVVVVAKIIEGVTANSDKGSYKETYNEVLDFLNQNML